MSVRIYIAAHSQDEARKVAAVLKDAGHVICSTWLQEDMKRASEYTDAERQAIADKDVNEVLGSDALILLASPYRVPGGKFVEVGVALGSAKPVYLLGHRENMLMYATGIRQFNSVEDMVRELTSKAI